MSLNGKHSDINCYRHIPLCEKNSSAGENLNIIFINTNTITETIYRGSQAEYWQNLL